MKIVVISMLCVASAIGASRNPFAVAQEKVQQSSALQTYLAQAPLSLSHSPSYPEGPDGAPAPTNTPNSSAHASPERPEEEGEILIDQGPLMLGAVIVALWCSFMN